MAGLMEASLLVQHTAAPPALHLRHLNQHLHGALAGHTGGWQCWCRQLCSLASGLLLVEVAYEVRRICMHRSLNCWF